MKHKPKDYNRALVKACQLTDKQNKVLLNIYDKVGINTTFTDEVISITDNQLYPLQNKTIDDAEKVLDLIVFSAVKEWLERRKYL